MPDQFGFPTLEELAAQKAELVHPVVAPPPAGVPTLQDALAQQPFAVPPVNLHGALGLGGPPRAPVAVSPAVNSPSNPAAQTLSNVLAAKQQAAKVPVQPNVPSVTESVDDGNDAANAEYAMDNYLYQGIGGRRGGVPPAIIHGTDFNKYGGEEYFKNAFEGDVARYETAARNEGAVNAGANAILAGQTQQANDNQRAGLANLMAQRQQHSQEFAAKQAEYDNAAKQYSNDLADSGKFWKNPTAIISGIAAALMELGTNHSNAGLGMKMLNEAIQRDFMARKQAADMHLGAMRSNLEGYRQIWQDKDAGDAYALAESYRIAMNDVSSLAQHLTGPRDQAKVQTLLAGLAQKNDMLRMQWHEKAYLAPQFVQKPIADTLNASPGFKSLIPKPGTPAQGPAASGKPSGISMETQNAAMKTLNGGKPTRLDAKLKRSDYDLSQESAKSIDARSKGASAILPQYKLSLERDAMLESGHPKGTPQFDKKFVELVNADKKAVAELARSGFEQKIDEDRGWGEFINDLNRIKAGAQLAGINPNDFIGARALPGQDLVSAMRKLQQMYPDLNTPAGRQAKEALDASERFHQMASGRIINYSKQMFGAISNSDVAQRGHVIDFNAPFEQIYGFAKDNGAKAGTRWQAFLVGLTPGQRKRIETRFGVKSSPQIDSQGYQKGQ